MNGMGEKKKKKTGVLAAGLCLLTALCLVVWIYVNTLDKKS